MKYGLIIYWDTDNLGDDIQSYATAKWLPHIDYYIDRENLHTFCPKDNRKTAVICSGWLLYEHLHWPPSPFIYPLNISMHFDTYYSRCWGNPLEDNLVLEEYGALWLNQNGPVGARDEYTLNLLRRFHIDTYFSGCITLTLNRFEDVKKHDRIVAVDISKELIYYIYAQTGEYPICKTHKINLAPYEISQRFAIVEEYLKIYQGASLVVTTRLHAALPAIALGTPVLFIKDTRFFNRTQTYLSRMNAVFEKDILSGLYPYDFNKPALNPNQCDDIRVGIIDKCLAFISDTKGTNGKFVPQAIVMQDLKKRIEHAKSLIQRNYDRQTTKADNFCKDN